MRKACIAGVVVRRWRGGGGGGGRKVGGKNMGDLTHFLLSFYQCHARKKINPYILYTVHTLNMHVSPRLILNSNSNPSLAF